MDDKEKTYPMNKQEPDVGMGAVYAGPDMPVTMFEDRAYIPNQPPMMMVYAGPQQMSDGGFISMFRQQMQQQMKPQKRQPEPGREVVGYCHECGAPFYARIKFCPEYATQLKFLK